MTLKSELISNIEITAEGNRTFKFLWLLAKYFAGFDRANESLPDTENLQEACLAILDGFNIDLISDQVPDWSKKESKQAVLVFGPHSAKIDPFLILSMVEREDVYFVAMNIAQELLPVTIQDRILPVTPTFMAEDAPRKPGLTGIAQLARRKLFTNDTSATVEEIKQSNQLSLQRAAELLNAGHVVVIYPCQTKHIETDRWYTGIGVILSELNNQNCLDKVMMQPFALTKISFFKLLLELRKRFVKQKMNEPKIKLTLDWMTTYPASVLTASDNPKQIVEQVKNRYVKENGNFVAIR